MDDLADDGIVALVEAEIVHLDEVAALREKTQRNGFAVGGRHCGYADVDILSADPYADSAIHRQTLFGDIEVGHDLYSRNDGGLQAVQLRRHVDLVKHAVDAVANAQLGLLRLDVDIGRALPVGFGDDLVDEADD